MDFVNVFVGRMIGDFRQRQFFKLKRRQLHASHRLKCTDIAPSHNRRG